LVTSLPRLQRMLAEVNHPHLKPMVDTCAMAVAGETLDDWFAAFGADIIHMHYVDGTPYGHLIWGDGDRPLAAYMQSLNAHGYCGYLGQEITDFRYFEDPAAADRRNMAHFRPFFTA
jgi:protein FrlC